MPEHDDGQAGYADAVDHYWQAGWRGVLPLRRAHKKTPPAGFTGRAGQTPSYADVLAWADLYPDGNLCLRLPDGVIGIDVDAYGAKTGAAALTEAEKRWGHLPDTVRTTSRSDGISGIRLYRIPAGVQLNEGIDFPDLGVGDIEIVQRHHRYALAWPSTHPEGGQYRWLNHAGQPATIPNIDDLPELPTAWIKALTHTPETILNPDAVYSTPEALTNGTPSSKVAQRLRQAIKELNLPGQSRHDTARKHVLALLRLGKLGETGVDQALRALGEMFTALVASDRPGGREEATREYRSMVTGIGAARALAQPSNTEWAHTIAATAINNAPEPEPLPVADIPETLEIIEEDFWTARDNLKLIYRAALSRMASPWAVLACCTARALTLVPPAATLPPIIGDDGSLNWFAALSAKSGGGKGAAMAVARILIDHEILVRGIGSGEGMIEVYQRNRKVDDDTPPVTSVLFSVDEIDSLGAMGGRAGQTTMSILRSGFSGEPLGYSYRGRQGETVAAHTYRMCVVASVQPARAGILFEDAGGGTPQRFQWFPARDKRITTTPPDWPLDRLGRPQVLPLLSANSIADTVGTITIPAQVADELRQARAASMSGDDNALDGHALFVREKFAYALAFMDARTEITTEDWRLATIASRVSDWCRNKALDGYQGGREALSRDRGHQRAIERDEQELQEHLTIQKHIEQLIQKIKKRLQENGPMTLGALNRSLTSRDRPRLAVSLQTAMTAGLLIERDGKWAMP